MRNATTPASRTILTATRLLAILGIGAGVLAGATPTEAQNYAPTRFRAEAVRHVDGGDAEVDLTWLHPTGANATGFTIHYTLTRSTHTTCATPTDPTTNLETAGGSDRRITIDRLDRETSACFWIRANFAEGNASGWTLVEDSPIDLRDETSIGTIPAPQRPSVTAGDARITVTFAAQSIPGFCRTEDGDLTTMWFYTRRLEGEPFGDNPTDTVHVISLAGSTGGYFPVVQNIANGNSYVFKIRLGCGVGGPISPWSEESDVVTPRGTINEITEPQGLSAIPVRVEGRDTAALRLTWGHPSSGIPDHYRLQYRRYDLIGGDGSYPWTSVTLPGAPPSYNITGLRFATDYEIQLRAEGPRADLDCDDVVHCGPWAKTSGNTGESNGPPVAVDNVAAVPGRTYEFRVRAVSAGGAGAWSAPTSVTVPELPTPSAPLNLVLESNAGDLLATWDEPANVDDVPVSGYTLRFRGTDINDKWYTVGVGANVLQARIPASYGFVRGGTYRAQVRASGAGGDGPWSAEAETTIPAEGPKPVITATIQPPANRPFTITVTFPEPVTNFTLNDLVIAGGDASEFTKTGAVYTALITPTDSGTLTIDIPLGAALDANGYDSEAADTFSIEVDITPPTGVITTAQPGPFKDPFTIKIIFSEPIQDLSLDNISISRGEVRNLQPTAGSEIEYTALVTPAGTGTLTIELPAQTFYDYNGHRNEEPVRFEVRVDTVRPTVKITSTSEPPIKGPFPLTFTFSEEVNGFERDDVEFPTGAGWLQTLHKPGPTTYTGTARPTTTGQIVIRVPENAATDTIGHGNEESEFELTAVIDDNPGAGQPIVEIWTTATSPVRIPFEIRIVFSEPVLGMTAEKLVVTNGSVGLLTDRQSARTDYSTILWPEENGTVTVNLPAGTVTDDLNNPNHAAPEFSIEAVLTPVPAVPTAGLILLGAALVAAGWRKRRQAARS